jgi:SAM-dependent methyltransferase
VGLDLKKTLLEKAEKLDIYKKTIQHDINKSLPFEENQFNTIFSNIFYWIDNLDQLISETYRILNKNGELVVFVPDKNFEKNMLVGLYPKTLKWVKMLDRGYHDIIGKHCYDYSKWERKFTSKGFKIKSHVTYMSEDFVKFWNIGLRDYSPYLIEMSNSSTQKTRRRIKSKIISEISPLISSYLKYEKSFINS